ncbi:MAG TPA: hypothetical protein VMU47_06675 [Caldimonas sp.]|nr:hypothetical protein [Caldimonas sp.]
MPVAYEYVSPGRTVDAFLKSEAFVVGIRGPFGSGKTSGGSVKVLMHANKQVVQKDKRKHSRYAIIRNTYPELQTTTIKTWHSWIPPTVGHWTSRGPPTHHIRDSKLDMEVIFVSLDREADVRKVLGMDLTGAFINEAREVPKALIDGLTARVGRYPPVRDGGCVQPQIWMDTNSPNVGHWWQILAEQDSSTEAGAQMLESTREAEKALRAKGLLKPHQPLYEFLSQPSALSPDAENLQNLPPDYYPRLMAGKTEEWIKVYVRNEYGFIQEGRPVYPEFREGLHVREFELDPRLPLSVGIDFGLTPAATIGQRSYRGIQRVRWEIVTARAGAKQMADTLRGFLNSTCANFTIESVTGDPSGDAGSQTDVTETCMLILRRNGLPMAKGAHTNDFTIRREAHSQAMTRLIDGEPGYQVHRYACPVLRRGLAGEYRYKKLATAAGADIYQASPEKNEVSHVCEADQYRMLGAGEGRVVVRGDLGSRRIRPAYSEM